MKKYYLIIITFLCCLCFICACKAKEITVNYLAGEGGVVFGELSQTITVGDSCTQVYALADSGYRFVGWSDGLTSQQRIDTNIEESKTITALFEKIEYVNITYIAEVGGNVYGELSQTIEKGENCTQVYALADSGYRFVGWSDGLTSRQRIDVDVEESEILIARFEPIRVLFYSDGLLVRDYTLDEFKTVDISKIVGYSSAKKFEKWEFTDIYSGYNNDDPLQLIQSHFSDMKDLSDIVLKAIYSESENINDVLENSKTIAHALGGLNNKNYLNSKEAFEYWYNKGQRFFEADVALTSDGVIVLNHDRSQYTYEAFMGLAEDGFTPITLENLFDYMVEYPEILVDLDTLGFRTNQIINDFVAAFKELIQNYDVSLINRLIVEIAPWNRGLIELLKNEIGINNFLYTEDWFTNDLAIFEQKCIYCKNAGINFVSIPYDWMLNNGESKIKILKENGLYVMAYTTNNIDIMYALYDIGVDCIFTDFTMI